MSENWLIQVSFKTPKGALINCRAETPEQLDNELGALEARIARIVALEQQLSGAGTVAAALPLAPQQPQPDQFNVANPWGPQPPAPQQQAAYPPPPFNPGAPAPQQQAAPQGGPLCKHNLQAKYVAGGISKKTGSAYRAFYACPLDRREQQCDFRAQA